MTRIAFLAVLALLTACTRPLSPNETAVAEALFGDTLDTSTITVTAGLGLLPPPPDPAPPEGEAATPRKAPENLCVRQPSTVRGYYSPAAFAFYDSLHFDERFYLSDTFAGFPDSVPYPSSLIMVHELVHVWQWQNRARTAYTISRSAGESVGVIDPYWFTVDPEAEFLSYGYEQQGAILEDFACYALFDRDDPKLDELAALLRPVLPVDGFLAYFER